MSITRRLTYEIVDVINEEPSVSEIRAAVRAECEPIDLAAVAGFLAVLAPAGQVTFTT